MSDTNEVPLPSKPVEDAPDESLAAKPITQAPDPAPEQTDAN